MLNKKRETQQVTDRGSSKLKKIEGNVKITSNRLTIPPECLTLGISSETFRKDTGKDNNCKRNEDLQGLFNKCLDVNSTSVRRSERILKKNIAHDSENTFRFVQDLPHQFFTSCRNVDIEKTPAVRDKPIWRNRSKSLFREINEKYIAKTAYFHPFNILTPPQENTSFESCSREKSSKQHSSTFCKNLSKQLRTNPGRKTLATCKSRILSKINEINSVLSGKTQPRTKMGTNVHISSQSFRNDSESSFKYYSQSEWVYETPPRQKIIIPRLEECQMHPAVIYTTKKDTNIYEISPSLNIDLNNCSGRRVNFDKRFLSHVDTLQHHKDIDLENNCHRKTNHKLSQVEDMEFSCFPMDQGDQKVSQEKPFNFTKPNPFIGLISRPQKTEKVSRIKNLLKRKLDTPNAGSFKLIASGSQGQDMFGNNFSPIGDDLQLTNFEFKKKLFCDMDNNNRGSDLDQPNLFDFSQ